MKNPIQLIIMRAYATLIRLYPQPFRNEFEAEMKTVFSVAVSEAVNDNIISLAAVCLRELWDLPLSLFREHSLNHKQKEDLTMSNRANLSVGWAFWLQWVLANIAGVVLVFAITGVLALIVKVVLGGGAEDKVPFFPVVGIGLGIMQWLALRQRLPRAGWWILASIAGWIAGFAMTGVVYLLTRSIVGEATNYEVVALIFALAIGASLGVTQWLVLRQSFSRTGWWVIANLVGWVVTFLAVGKSLDRFVDLVSLSVVPPAVTGLALVWLLRPPVPNVPGLGPSGA